MQAGPGRQSGGTQRGTMRRLWAYIHKYWFLYILALPGTLYLLVFRYIPMGGLLIAFKDYQPRRGILGSRFVGLANFQVLFQDKTFYLVLGNTVLLNLLNLALSFTFTIFLALMLNELLSHRLKKLIQTVVYLPNFLSWVVFSGIVSIFLSPSEGPINRLIAELGGTPVYFLIHPEYFRAILIVSGTIKSAGFGTIIYLSSLAGIDPGLYESATIDGANRGQMLTRITLPRIYPTIAVMLMLELANIFGSNFEQVFTLYNPLVYSTGDVLSTYLYRTGLLQGKFEMSTALSLILNSIGLATVLATNRFIRKLDVVGIL